ncbi:hypothetical protein FQA39_LY15360 [Lamprigera yunnana]|nr:hypothetical protein FQA39_LY15360 [Lamprigera yunnana]
MTHCKLEISEPKDRWIQPCHYIYGKNVYRPKIKITNWEFYDESQPRDHNPYCLGNLNYHSSHYDRLGRLSLKPLVSESHQMLDQIHLKEDVTQLDQIPYKYMVNYYTYTDTSACKTELPEKCKSDVYALTTFQSITKKDYKPPQPYVMKKWDNETNSPSKYFDDNYIEQLRNVQCIKNSKMKSFDPMTLKYTDGTIPPERQHVYN